MPLVKDITIKKKNNFSVLIGDVTILNTELEKFYNEYKKNPNWDSLSDFEKAKVLAYIFIIAGKYKSFILNNELLEKYGRQLRASNKIEEYLKKSIANKNKIVESIVKQLEELDILYIEYEAEFKKFLTPEEIKKLEEIKEATLKGLRS